MMTIIRSFPGFAGSFYGRRTARCRRGTGVAPAWRARRPRRKELTDASTPSILASSQFNLHNVYVLGGRSPRVAVCASAVFMGRDSFLVPGFRFGLFML